MVAIDEPGSSELAELEARTSHRFDWGGAPVPDLVGLAEHLLAAGYALRLSLVGYGMAVRVSVTDQRGWSTGWTVGSGAELRLLCRGLCAAEGLEYVSKRLEKPARTGRR